MSESEADELEQLLRARIEGAGEGLASEREMMRILFHGYQSTPDQPALPVLKSGPVAAAILRSGLATTRTQGLGAASVMTVSHSLHWDILTAIFGGEEGVAAAAARVREEVQINDERLQQALSLVDRYLEGWRPPDSLNDFGNDE